MQVVTERAGLREALDGARAQGRAIHLVPTMGNLHAGHMALIERLRDGPALVVASIFVNPAQFGPGEDFERYPRTPEEDLEKLGARGCDLVWMPELRDLYPHGLDQALRISVPSRLGDCLCGIQRPGHFDGVAGVVLRLFHQVSPDRAAFGEKDFQQLVIIRYLVADLALPIEIVPVATVRDPDGLALSSRNRYLTKAERKKAPELAAVLRDLAERLRAGQGTFDGLRRSAWERLEASGFRLDYLELRSESSLGPPEGVDDRLFVAARLGRARLIDNWPLTGPIRPG